MTTYRDLPSVDRLTQVVASRTNGSDLPRELLVQTVRDELGAARRAIAANQPAPGTDALVETVLARLEQLAQPSLRTLINATGVIIQTNLGRAPLSAAALAAMQEVGAGYSNLEYDLDVGERGSRSVHLGPLLCQLTGAQAALAVNNNAAALYLALSALAQGREVIVSRGQAVEIGGGFRIPDVLRQSGATLVEVGTTNRTYARDYAAAINERTALLLRVHTSNFRLLGFVHETSLVELCEVGRTHGVPVLDDLGSGTLLSTAPYGLAPEPTVGESVTAGADLVTFSGDKLLGGPQAGLIVGREELVAQLRQHPLARALRVDKTTLAGLEATLLAYLRGRAFEEIPVWQMIAAPLEQVQARAERIAIRLRDHGVATKVVSCASAVGGGSLPGETLASAAVAVETRDTGHNTRDARHDTDHRPPTTDLRSRQSVDELAAALRVGRPPVIGRIAEGQLLLDVRTVLPQQEDDLVAAIVWAASR